MCLAVLMSVSLITHYSDYNNTNYWILIFTQENQTYYIKCVFKNLCLLSLKKGLYCPLKGVEYFSLASLGFKIPQDIQRIYAIGLLILLF